MIISTDLTIDVGGNAMPCYLSRPAEDGTYPAVIVLEGIYGFDDELRRITDLVASFGYVGMAINYFHRTHPELHEPFTDEGRARGEAASVAVKKDEARADVGAARDWLNDQTFVASGHIATWGFGFGGTIAFVTATLAGLQGATVFYGQSIVSGLPSGESAPISDVKEIRTPLLLVFGGEDKLISQRDIDSIVEALQANNKKFEIQLYPNVGHSFFRATMASASNREAADAWDREQAFLAKYVR